MGLWERISAAILVAFGIFVAVYSYHYLKLGVPISPDAGFLPFLIGIVVILLGTLWCITSFSSARSGEPCGSAGTANRRGFPRKFVLSILVTIVYSWLFEKLGYFFSTMLFMLGWQLLVEKERWLKTAVISVVCTAAMYVLFIYLLKVHLPAGEWFS